MRCSQHNRVEKYYIRGREREGGREGGREEVERE